MIRPAMHEVLSYMTPSRRFLPSTAALIAFEAVARTGSATAAARDLNLTQSGISRQIKTLEAQIGARLVTREGRALVLTPAGREYARHVTEILRKLAAASVAARTNPEGGTLNLAILPAFGMHWLAPRLQDFAHRHPEVTVNLSTRLAPFDFGLAHFDAAIHFGREDWAGTDSLPLMPETVVPVCAPGLFTSASPDTRAAEIAAHPLLHLDTRPKGWARWLAAQGIDAPLATGMMFDQFSTMAQAAIHGMGIALLPTFVADPYLASGALELAAPHTSESIGSYYLVWPPERATRAPLVSFRTWLQGQTQQAASA